MNTKSLTRLVLLALLALGTVGFQSLARADEPAPTPERTPDSEPPTTQKWVSTTYIMNADGSVSIRTLCAPGGSDCPYPDPVPPTPVPEPEPEHEHDWEVVADLGTYNVIVCTGCGDNEVVPGPDPE